MGSRHSTGPEAVLDEIVAVYAPLGARQRRSRQLKLATLFATGITIAATAAWLRHADVSLLDNLRSAFYAVDAAGNAAGNEVLARRSAALENAVAALESRIEAMTAQNLALESERARYAEQRRELEQLLAEAEQTRGSSAEGQNAQLDREIEAIAAQRAALEARWTQFEAQGELLATEIIAINAQRKELEAQRRQIERQREQLAALLEQAARLERKKPQFEHEEFETAVAATGDDGFFHTENSLTVDAGELDEMRGGFAVGEGLDFSFGFEQTGSINGIEQFQNTFSIDSVRSGFENVDLSNMNSVLLQNGTGNFVSSGALDALAGGFGNVIQNSLDDQVISTMTIYDISLHNLPGTVQGLAGGQALSDSLGAFR